MAKKKDFLQGKYPLELNIVHPKAIFLNFWDYDRGNDVVVEIIGDKLFQQNDEDDAVEISFENFIAQVIESIQKRTV